MAPRWPRDGPRGGTSGARALWTGSKTLEGCEQAYGHSGRTLNITCTPLKSRGNGAPPLMLNHIDTPHIDIASAVTASACVPGLIEPVVLLERGPDGALRPLDHLDARLSEIVC